MSFESFPYSDFHSLNLDWILRKMKELIEQWAIMKNGFIDISKAFEELKEYLDKFFKHLDLQDEVNKKLEEMASTGELYSLLNEYNNSFHLHRIARTMYESGKFGSITNEYCYPQGIAYNAAEKELCIAYEKYYNSDNKIMVRYFSTDMDFKREKLINLQHCNSLFYNNGKMYVALGIDETSYYTSDWNFTTIQKIDMGLVVNSIVAFDNKIVTSNGKTLSFFNYPNELVFTFDIPYQNGTFQNMYYNSGRLYICYSNPNFISVVSFTNNSASIVKTIALDRFYELYPVGELEGLVYVGNKMIVSSVMYLNQPCFFFNNIWEYDITKGNPSNNMRDFTVSQPKVIVDYSVSSKNPTGSQDSQFNSLQEALISNSAVRGSFEIDINNLKITENCYITENCSIVGASTRTRVGKTTIVNRASAVFTNIDVSIGADDDTAFYLLNAGNVTIVDMNIYHSSGKAMYGIYNINSMLSINGIINLNGLRFVNDSVSPVFATGFYNKHTVENIKQNGVFTPITITASTSSEKATTLPDNITKMLENKVVRKVTLRVYPSGGSDWNTFVYFLTDGEQNKVITGNCKIPVSIGSNRTVFNLSKTELSVDTYTGTVLLCDLIEFE